MIEGPALEVRPVQSESWGRGETRSRPRCGGRVPFPAATPWRSAEASDRRNDPHAERRRVGNEFVVDTPQFLPRLLGTVRDRSGSIPLGRRPSSAPHAAVEGARVRIPDVETKSVGWLGPSG